MRDRNFFIGIAMFVWMLCGASGLQQGLPPPVGPVTPRAPQTAETYEKALGALLEKGSGDALWNVSDPDRRMRIWSIVQDLSEEIVIQGLPVGPVTPRPPVPTPDPGTPPPNPAPPKQDGPTPPPTNPPTKAEWDEAFKGLHGALQRVSETNSQFLLPSRLQTDLQVVIDGLEKSRP